MSFGFSVGDFIEIAEKAYKLYERCSAAPGEYQSLAASVLILHEVLDATKLHVQAEEQGLQVVPERKKSALVLARCNCDITLDEIDALLLKRTSLGSNVTAKWLDRVRFITSDASALEKRLVTNRANLSLCLESLTSLSVHRLEKAYQEVIEDYRSGRKEPSLLSEALVKHKSVDIQEAMNTAESDLLEKNIHPDSLDLHKDEIQKWVMSTIVEEEEMPVRVVAPEDPKLSAFAPPKTAEEENLYDGSPVMRPASPQPQRPESPGRLTQLPPPSDAPSSRRPSDASCRSKGESWHPSNEPKQNYVHSMLVKGFQTDPLEQTYDFDNASFYFKRAFHQQDCHERGYLDRYEVVSICRRAIKQVDPAADDSQIEHYVHTGDQNHDGRVDKDEFLIIMHNVIQEMAEDVGTRMRATFSSVSEAAEKLAESRRRSIPSRALPWGFRRTGCPPFFDEVEQKEYDAPPELLPPWSFTAMANDVAGHCVEVLGPVGNQWSKVLPTKQDRKLSLQTFEKVRQAALNFTNFFNPAGEKLLSDLDEIMTVLSWLEIGEPQHTVTPQNHLDDLRAIRDRYYALAQHIKGFVYRLTYRDPDDFSATAPSDPLSTTNYPQEHIKWEKSRMDQWANLIESQASDDAWEQVKETIRHCRDWYRQAGESQPKGILHAKRFAVETQPSRSFSSHSQDVSINALHFQAMEIARKYCKMDRGVEDKEIEMIRSQGRPCRLMDVWFERKGPKSRISFGKPHASKLRLYVDAIGPGTCRRVWTAPDENLKPGSLGIINFTLPHLATSIRLQIHEPYPGRSSSQDYQMLGIWNGKPETWDNEYGALKFSAYVGADPAKDYERSPFPWLQYVKNV